MKNISKFQKKIDKDVLVDKLLDYC